MIFTPTTILGAYKIDLEKRGDGRGFFARMFCKNELIAHNLNPEIAQINTSLTASKGTFRGLHYQLPPKAEDKILKVLRGSLYDIILDVRPKSATYGQYCATELSSENRTMVYIPKGCAHGYLILEDSTEIIYLVSEFYCPENERAIRWNDPKFNIKLPYEPTVVSDKDANAKDFDENTHLNEAMYLL
jgi:dTDP-4-dehydrorhamnose 3,5-epimerase